MSEATANLNAMVAADPTVLPTATGDAAGIPTGANGVNADGTPKKKKGPKKGSKRNKPSKAVYAVPDGKLQSSETPAFNVAVHRKLTVNDFADPLHYAQWNVGYFKDQLARAEQEVTEMQSMGNTPEERNAAKEQQRLMKAMENFVARQKAAGIKLPSGLQDRLGKLYGEVSM